MQRREFIRSGGMLAAAAALPAPTGAGEAPSILKPKRLKSGDTVTLVAPANATFNTVELQVARESLEALGVAVKVGAHPLDRHGYLAGDDQEPGDYIDKGFAE